MQMDMIRELIQKNMPNDKVRNVWFLGREIGDNILYGVSGNNNKLFAVARITPMGEITILR